MNKLNEGLSQMTLDQLVSEVKEMRRELFKLRLNSATAHVKSFSSKQAELKKAIARGLTHINQRVIAEIRGAYDRQ